MSKLKNGAVPSLLLEFIRYCIVGGTAFLFDYAVLFYLTEYMRLYYLFSSVLGFITGIVINYYLSKWWVFTNAKAEGFQSFLLFFLIGVMGLGMTVTGMWLGVELLQINYMFVKVGVTGFVLLWNYTARKRLVFQEVRYEGR